MTDLKGHNVGVARVTIIQGVLLSQENAKLFCGLL
jgi:hypothetical protein